MFRVQVLGCSSAVPAFGRHPSAQYVQHHERGFLVDCGEGTQMQMLRYGVRFKRLEAIFITHLHGDHVFGLPGLLNTLSLNNRQEELHVFGPPGLRMLLEDVFKHSQGALRYPLKITEIGSPDHSVIYETPFLAVEALPLNHKVACIGFLFREKPKRPQFLALKAQEMLVPKAYFRLLKLGNAVTLPDGRVIEPAVLQGPTPPQYSFAYCSDTAYRPALAERLQNVSLLYHEATFLETELARAIETAHSTAAQAAALARDAGAGRLLMGHFSARYKTLDGHLAEARAVFPQSWLAFEGQVYTIGPGTAEEAGFVDRKPIFNPKHHETEAE
jgi:ribonuclease Z